MTNDTTPHQEGVADAAISAALTTVESIKDAVTGAIEAVTGGEIAEEAAPVEPKPPSFEDLGLHPDILQSVADMGYFTPTPVQTAVFKPVSEGKDLLVQSRTGTGKTTAFGLPTINKIIPTHRAPQALILAPTRELALQVSRELTNLGKNRGVIVEPIYGGAPIGKQIANLKAGVHIIVGTPGRVLDHIGRRTSTARTSRRSSSTSATRCCRWASSRTSSASSPTSPRRSRPCCSRRRCRTRSRATRAAT